MGECNNKSCKDCSCKSEPELPEINPEKVIRTVEPKLNFNKAKIVEASAGFHGMASRRRPLRSGDGPIFVMIAATPITAAIHSQQDRERYGDLLDFHARPDSSADSR